MRSCQVCGCASWGPIGNPAELDRLGEFVPTVDAAFVRCDNCKAIARADLLRDAEFKPDPITSPSQPLPDFITETLARVMPAVPAPPTRLERLTVALLRSGMFSKTDTTNSIVNVARYLEVLLDQPMPLEADIQAKRPWLTLSFPAREEFEYWCTGLWDVMDKVVGGELFSFVHKDYPQQLYDAAATYALKK